MVQEYITSNFVLVSVPKSRKHYLNWGHTFIIPHDKVIIPLIKKIWTGFLLNEPNKDESSIHSFPRAPIQIFIESAHTLLSACLAKVMTQM